MNPVEGYVLRLVKSFFLPPDTAFYLDSIGAQIKDAGLDDATTMRQLDHAASIAKFYRLPIEVLKKLDKAMPDYLKSGNRKGLANLHRAEHERFRSGQKKLEITDLDSKIQEHMSEITQP